MWKYDCVTREEFEKVKYKVEEYIVMLGGKEVSVQLPYKQKTVSYSGDSVIECNVQRPVFEYKGEYYHVDEVCFERKPYIVIECGRYDELMKYAMEDADPFPYDLLDGELLNEVKYSLGIEPYPVREDVIRFIKSNSNYDSSDILEYLEEIGI